MCLMAHTSYVSRRITDGLAQIIKEAPVSGDQSPGGQPVGVHFDEGVERVHRYAASGRSQNIDAQVLL